jgi:hypothetical protein
MILPDRPVHDSPDTDICNVAAVPFSNAAMQGHPNTIRPMSMNEAAIEARELRVSSGVGRPARTVLS